MLFRVKIKLGSAISIPLSIPSRIEFARVPKWLIKSMLNLFSEKF